MGFLVSSTPEMAPYGVEVRSESFYLHGEDDCEYLYGGAEQPRHSPVIYIHTKEVKDEPVLSDKERSSYRWIIEHGQFNDPVVRDALNVLLVDGESWKIRAESAGDSVSTSGLIEFLIEDIPKIRACLDAVETHVKENR